MTVTESTLLVVGVAVGAALVLGASHIRTSGADKVLVVRDGSVDVFQNATLGDLNGKRHKWSEKADTVEIRNGATATGACDNSLVPPTAFESVEVMADPAKVTIVNAGGLFGIGKKLELQVDEGDAFKFDDTAVKWEMYRGQKKIERLTRVTVTVNGTPTEYKPGGGFLCAKFKHKV
jgi:hypothetical protein